jgi:hypothetical protein
LDYCEYDSMSDSCICTSDPDCCTGCQFKAELIPMEGYSCVCACKYCIITLRGIIVTFKVSDCAACSCGEDDSECVAICSDCS